MVLDVEDLQVAFPTRAGWLRAVDGISFRVSNGETLAIVGESGCGKSATVRTLMGLSRGAHVRGKAMLDGTSLLDQSQARKLRGTKISMIFQDPMTTLNPTMRIGDQVSEPLIHHRVMSRSKAKRRARDLLEEVQIQDPLRVARSYPHQLSGGMRQRVVIAMALACNPEIILADEPTTALDVTVQAEILELLLDLQRQREMGLVLITHDMGVVLHAATRVMVMYAGQAIELGPAQEVFDDPAHPYTAALMQCLPTMTGPNPRQDRLKVIAGSPPDLTAPPLGCRFAPRCPVAGHGEACSEAVSPIPLRERSSGHFVRTLTGESHG